MFFFFPRKVNTIVAKIGRKKHKFQKQKTKNETMDIIYSKKHGHGNTSIS